MKNLIPKLIFVFLFLICSCSSEDTGFSKQQSSSQENFSNTKFASKGTIPEEELAKALSVDSNFVEYGDLLVDFFENMPKRDYFQKNFKQADFEKEGEQYFLQMSGYTNS
ncbi:hypothetical protein [Flavobacterium psychrotrophum]|uniref:hypothetical protein n=1 Tax=Flavobacterium psychrotrophum TaxID=2294119 RepID=UPI0013C4C5EB|nr:hypothetical protein [Flavobacterium psychrotrophum]